MAKRTKKRERIPKGMTLAQFIIDKNLHRQFKSRCVGLGVKMSSQIEELIRAWVRKTAS